MKENEKIRKAARVADIRMYAIAKEIGVSEPTLTRWLRSPLPKDKEDRIMKAIAELAEGVD